MNKKLQKIKDEWDWIYKNGKLDEEAVLKELLDYNFVLEQVPIVYEEITGGLLSKPNYKAGSVLAEFESRFWDKEMIIDDIKGIMKSATSLEELKEELKEYLV